MNSTPSASVSTSIVRCRIHRGCHEIGGNCVEIRTADARILLDVGLPLNDDDHVVIPPDLDLQNQDGSLCGIFISHPHPDHYGLLSFITQEEDRQPISVHMGAEGLGILNNSQLFTSHSGLGEGLIHPYSAGDVLKAGPFTITPLRIDHSAHDSYCFLIEVEGKRIFYSGDLRAHGRGAHYFRDLVLNPPPDIDVLICEGTQVGHLQEFRYPDEESVALAMAEEFKRTPGMGLVWCSSQNVDRVVSVYEACRITGRTLVLDMYTAEILRAVNRDDVPVPGKEDVVVYLPRSQRRQIKKNEAYHISNQYSPYRVYPEHLEETPSKYVMLCRSSMFEELISARCLEGATLITSLWSGYLKQEREATRLDNLRSLGVRQAHIHSSGHATVDELKQFIAAFPDSRIIPIHLDDREAFAQLSVNVELKNDGEWWKV
ncbi:Ribonuclease J 1 [Polystyrenella longa]|uniref:Ribonuclease J 1 n=1 Tax=Polystyrenella longa TaxID=2528007 RepID=A0A518CTQ0_9PLAN|nr:MBL fold metallo-hydrolase [Polystyrenella longa]QDU82611.1 Ribonuclease J 1 [Polystyrenella longa]